VDNSWRQQLFSVRHPELPPASECFRCPCCHTALGATVLLAAGSVAASSSSGREDRPRR
jgi:hypothetical protein